MQHYPAGDFLQLETYYARLPLDPLFDEFCCPIEGQATSILQGINSMHSEALSRHKLQKAGTVLCKPKGAHSQ